MKWNKILVVVVSNFCIELKRTNCYVLVSLLPLRSLLVLYFSYYVYLMEYTGSNSWRSSRSHCIRKATQSGINKLITVKLFDLSCIHLKKIAYLVTRRYWEPTNEWKNKKRLHANCEAAVRRSHCLSYRSIWACRDDWNIGDAGEQAASQLRHLHAERDSICYHSSFAVLSVVDLYHFFVDIREGQLREV